MFSVPPRPVKKNAADVTSLIALLSDTKLAVPAATAETTKPILLPAIVVWLTMTSVVVPPDALAKTAATPLFVRTLLVTVTRDLSLIHI